MTLTVDRQPTRTNRGKKVESEPKTKRSAATMLLTRGVPERVILDALSQSDMRMVARYPHVSDSLRQDAADAADRSLTGAGPVKLPVRVEEL